MPRKGVEPLEVVAISQVCSGHDHSGWLIEGLFCHQGVGVIGGVPKSCKTWLGLDLAVSVSSGTPALGRFPVVSPGPVILFGAEDEASHLRERIEAIALSRGLALDALPLGLIVAPCLRLDTERDRARLRATLEKHRPRLLLLDPLVRLHRIDENSASEVSALLGELRAIQRAFSLAIVLVHHLRKNGAVRGREGQGLRGSGDIHAWGDSNLYLNKCERRIRLTIEHRNAPAPEPCILELASDPPHLRLFDGEPFDTPQPPVDVAARIIEVLSTAHEPMSREALRAAVRARNATLCDALSRLRSEHRIARNAGGFFLMYPDAVPNPQSVGNGNGGT